MAWAVSCGAAKRRCRPGEPAGHGDQVHQDGSGVPVRRATHRGGSRTPRRIRAGQRGRPAAPALASDPGELAKRIEPRSGMSASFWLPRSKKAAPATPRHVKRRRARSALASSDQIGNNAPQPEVRSARIGRPWNPSRESPGGARCPRLVARASARARVCSSCGGTRDGRPEDDFLDDETTKIHDLAASELPRTPKPP